jgi:hypothetical protein
VLTKAATSTEKAAVETPAFTMTGCDVMTPSISSSAARSRVMSVFYALPAPLFSSWGSLVWGCGLGGAGDGSGVVKERFFLGGVLVVEVG